MQKTVLSCLLLVLAGCDSVPSGKPDPRDTWERFNRSVFNFNEALDRAIAKPVAKGYVKVTPRVIRTGISNAYSNLDTVPTIINDVLQGKIRQAGHDSARFLMNSTLGLGGLFDPASAAGLDSNDEDLGQTLGKWGVKSGPYLMLPLMGPSDLRDGVASIGQIYTDPVHYVDSSAYRYGLTGVRVIDLRAGLLQTDQALANTYDKYQFIKNAYLQRREYLVTDGQAAPSIDDEPLEDPEAPATK